MTMDIKELCAMPEAELQKLKNSIPSFWDGERTPEQILLEKQINWIEMIDSCLCYGALHKLEEEYLHSKTYDLPVEMKRQIMNGHITFLQSNAHIERNVYTDNEYVSYNSLTY